MVKCCNAVYNMDKCYREVNYKMAKSYRVGGNFRVAKL